MSLEQNDSAPKLSARDHCHSYELVFHKMFSLRGAGHDAPAFGAGKHDLLLL